MASLAFGLLFCSFTAAEARTSFSFGIEKRVAAPAPAPCYVVQQYAPAYYAVPAAPYYGETVVYVQPVQPVQRTVVVQPAPRCRSGVSLSWGLGFGLCR